MEEQEKIDIREHLIGWIDTLLKDGIVPQVVNPKAIRANSIPKSKIKEKIEEYQLNMKKYEYADKKIFNENNIRQEVITVLTELLMEDK